MLTYADEIGPPRSSGREGGKDGERNRERERERERGQKEERRRANETQKNKELEVDFWRRGEGRKKRRNLKRGEKKKGGGQEEETNKRGTKTRRAKCFFKTRVFTRTRRNQYLYFCTNENQTRLVSKNLVNNIS
jgi:hypothetical protein